MNLHNRLVESTGTDPTAMVESMIAPIAASFAKLPAARFALETALFDLLGKTRQVTVAECLGGSAQERVALNGVIGTDGDVEAWIEQAKALMARNIRVVKIKVGRSHRAFEAEREALFRLRDTLPRDARIRLDANGSFGDDAREHLSRLSNLAPEFVEEPTRGQELAQLGECAVPWAVDESLADEALLDRFLDHSACAVVVLKPAILGGLIRSRKIALRAQARGKGVVVTHLFDGDVAHAAACELALSLDAPMACGLDHHAGLKKIPAHLATPGFVTKSGQAGLGISS
jgi:L-alanine-DL-glutamate epimerase-like enolase superfamily enzyme